VIKKLPSKDKYLIGIISDTHGRLPNSVADAFKGVNLIIHAGDIGDPAIIDALKKIAPTIAVRGNTDFGQWADRLAAEETIEISQTRLIVLHDAYRLKLISGNPAPDVVISGHTHRPQQEENQGLLYINPGSAAYPRYRLPATVAILQIKEHSLRVRFTELES
jgi:putative phosphoesterase